ncbi:hypothetical protein C5167_017784 [Papaver somniferum]|uniref:Uncharacterized protein n=1 Tax=Papaver somniferum TaxID=3469 RepID=A0A4Y7IPG3_PAPSO|nr:hypothetical protein C5167_017784 [Papaver somniferum]
MGRPPCCDKVLGITKGPWTPEEDLILASYIEEHGPGNWRSVPTNAGLLRCSKSCRLRWSNYLRPGIKRGNFTEFEEKKIITLQSLWGNKWAAIASNLPQRTDNDIKNYWNTHLKKKLKKFHSVLHPHHLGSSSKSFEFLNKDYKRSYDRTSFEYHHLIHQASALNKFISSTITNSITSWSSSTTTTYASSTGNISRLLEGWMRTSPNKLKDSSILKLQTTQTEEKVLPGGSDNSNNDNHNTSNNNLDDDDNLIIKKVEVQETCNGDDYLISNEADYLESLLKFDSTTIHESTSASSKEPQTTNTTLEDRVDSIIETNHQGLVEDDQDQPPFSLLEKCLLDEATGQILEEDQMEISPIC